MKYNLIGEIRIVMRAAVLCIVLLGFQVVRSQTQMGNSFNGQSNPAAALCPQSKGAFTDEQVNRLIDDILALSNLKNRFITIPCAGIPNCQAVYFEGKPYILYNATFLEDVKRFGFSEREIVTTDRNWEALTILAHELGHHFNNHLNNPPPGSTSQSLELEADEYAGFVIYMLGGSLAQAQLAYQSLAENPTYTHPGRRDRLEAIGKGWINGEARNPKGRTVVPNSDPVIPKNNPEAFKSVTIGSQEWMTENLNVDRFRNGDLIMEAKTQEEWKQAGENNKPAWCYYDNEPNNGKKYGKLYNWCAVNDPRGIAPAGWHIPTKAEWEMLIENLGGYKKSEFKLKSPVEWTYFRENKSRYTNESGFNAMPGGARWVDVSFEKIEENGVWWSSSKAWIFSIYSFTSNINNVRIENLASFPELIGFSVRCIKD